jgi:hypothetical protein
MSEAPLTLDEIKETLLSAWYSGAELAAGVRVVDAKEAATHAVMAVLNVTEGQRGVVRVLAPTPETKRSIMNYLTAYFADEPRLKSLVSKATPDGFALSGGIRVSVDTTDARLVRDAVATIVLDPTANEAIGHVWHEPDETREECAIRHGYDASQVSQLSFIRWLRPGEGPAVAPSVFEPGPPPEDATTDTPT